VGELIVCVRIVRLPDEVRQPFLAWIEENRQLRERHGILFELVLERSVQQNPPKAMPPAALGADSEEQTLVITAWPSHEMFDAWIETSDRDRLTDSEVHRSVEFGPITRYDIARGYLNLEGLKAVVQSWKEDRP
jgi:hypothetical protein